MTMQESVLPYFTCKKSYVKINNGITIRKIKTREVGIKRG